MHKLIYQEYCNREVTTWGYLPSNSLNIQVFNACSQDEETDVDGDENVNKTIGFISKTTALHVHHTFFVYFLPVFARLRRENA